MKFYFNISLEVFKERGLNHDLLGNFFDIVLFEEFHFGFGYHDKLLFFKIQIPKKTYFFDFWFSKKRFNNYFYGTRDSLNYTKHILLG
jgi:hypothetical protein